MKIGAAYIRVSTEDQTEYSPDSQLKAIMNYAQRNNIYLAEQYIFEDDGISGRSTGKREAFNKMIALAKNKPKPFDVILVWKFSRFARNREDSIVYKSMLRKQCGIDVVSISESIGDDKMSVLFEAMIEAMDEYYSINLAEEVKRGMTEKAKRGGVLSIPAFGYKVEDNRYVIAPEEAAVINKAFADYANGKGFLTIAKELNAMGVKSHRGNRIENRTVEYWLNNPVYIGKIRWNPSGQTSRRYHDNNLIITDGDHEPIISDELWNKVQQMLEQRKNFYQKRMREPTNGMKHWLRGVLRCGLCGSTLVYNNGFYYCNKKGKGLCRGNGGVSTNVIEKLVLDKIDEIITFDNTHVEFAKAEPVFREADSEERVLKAKIDGTQRRLEKIKEAYQAGVDTIDEYKAAKQKIEKEIEGLNERLSDVVNKESISEKSSNDESRILLLKNLKKVSDILKSPAVSNETKSKVIRSVVKEIIKTGEDGRTFKIIFNNPL